MQDVIIIGSGPAGMSAAVNAKARNVNPLILGRKLETSSIWKAENIDNHLGMPGVTGKEIMNAFKKHIIDLDIEVKEGRVLQIMQMGQHFMINFDNDIYETKSIILSTGIANKAKIKGEEEYVGKGVSYCATCDGMLYKNKTAVLISEIDEGAEEANFLSEICEKTYFINKAKKLPDNINDNVIVVDEKLLEITGDEFVTGVKTDKQTIPTDVVFFVRESAPLDSLLPDVKTEKNFIVVNRQMETNVAGVFACGDVTGTPYQLSKAIGEGQIAGQSAAKYVKAFDKKNK